ncbi:hypothetical protein QVD17_21219 [Tagetes erecta]|uniref:Uncharacterized protein n=1 Tax=Tagetes erecta TaxID=13708 RepID=A0AAD8KQL2_TARER|nr:hypothetical protein QVD17_21219 [Tagetes erecta]
MLSMYQAGLFYDPISPTHTPFVTFRRVQWELVMVLFCHLYCTGHGALHETGRSGMTRWPQTVGDSEYSIGGRVLEYEYYT